MAAVRKPKKSRKQAQIVKTAEMLFTRHGLKRVTVEEICLKAKVSKMTFYKYFSNKIDLVRCIWDKWTDEGYAKLDEIDALDIPLPEKIQTMFKWKTDFISKISPELIEELIPLNLEHEKFFSRFMDFIARAQKRGEIRPEVHPKFLMAVLDKLHELGHDSELRSAYPSLVEFQREVKDFFWYGVIGERR